MKFNNAEDAKAFITSKREDKETAKGELKAFLKENKLDSKADHSEHAKHGKKYKKLQGTVEKLTKEIEEAKNWMESNKPEKKSKGGGTKTTYDYPADITSEADKKKYRAKMRAAKAKGETPAKEEKSSKKDKKKEGKAEETATTETKSDKKDKKDKKKEKTSKED